MRWLITTIKILFWTIMAVVLLVVGSLLCTVKLLKPRQLTPITERVANRMLNADVSVGCVALELRQTYPFLNLCVDDLTVISRDIRNQAQEIRDTLPIWADTLLSLQQIKGGINLAKLVTGTISLNDVEIVRPQINIFIANDSLNNFSVAKPSDEPETESTTNEIPDLRIKSFKLIDPQPIRYADATTDTRISLAIQQTAIDADPYDLETIPKYNVIFKSNIETSLLSLAGLSELLVSFDGTVDWNHKTPNQVGLEDFKFEISAITGTVNTVVDFQDELTINSFELDINPVSVTKVLNLIDPATAKSFGIPNGISTNAEIALKIALTQPYTVGLLSIPYALVTLDIPDCHFYWRKIDLRHFAFKATATINGLNLNAATIDIENLTVAGPATTIKLQGKLSNMIRDPMFNGSVNGYINLDKFPPVITNMLNATLKGSVSANASIKAKQSMLSRNGFHNLKIRGSVQLKDFFYQPTDSQSMYWAQNATLRFGSNEQIKRENAETGQSITFDSLLTVSIKVDTMHIFAGGINMDAANLSLGVGAQNRNAKADTTAIIPIGGKLSVDRFILVNPTDSFGFRMRQLSGIVSMRRYQNDAYLPLFTINANIKRLNAGDNATRFMISDGHLEAKANKLPDSELSKGRLKLKLIADSLHREMPGLDIDSIYNLATEIRRSQRRASRKNAQNHQDNDTEIIEWETSTGMKRLLLDWNLHGNLTARRARLFTASFPLRNRVNGLNITFDNDSILFNDIKYKAGHSDFTVTGKISNMKRALTSRRGRQSLKLNFDLFSDTIDVNELAKAFFTGAAHKGTKIETGTDSDDDDWLDNGALLEDDASGPLLIPTNIDVEIKVAANNVLYSDLLLHNLKGTVLAYDGALNLHDLQAASAVGKVNLSALYSAPTTKDMNFGFGMVLKDFNIANFLRLVPAVDSMMPLMRDFSGIINANIAATADVDTLMNLKIPTLHAAINLSGDSLVVIDPETFKLISKWLLFKDKNKNMIDSMSVEMIVEDNKLQLFPFVFNFDRYKLGVQGFNDLDMNFNYHVAVLKSPLPFKFGVNVKGNIDDFKVRLGRAHFNEKQAYQNIAIADTTRVNLIRQFENVFRRGVRNSKFANLQINQRPDASQIDLNTDTLSATDSIYFKNEGLIPKELEQNN